MNYLITLIIALFAVSSSFGQSEHTCRKHELHTVNHSYLFKKIGDDLPITYNPAKYKKGEKGVMKYFEQNPISKEILGEELVVNLYFSFLVNCHGKADQFTLINGDDMESLKIAQAVIDLLQKLPAGWIPATSKKKAVDSYQVVEFTFVQGNIQRVSFN